MSDTSLRTPRFWVYILGFVGVAALVTALASFTILQERGRYRERAIVATQNIAALLEQHTHDVFEQVEHSVRTAALYAAETATGSMVDAARLNRMLTQQERLIPELRGFRMTDAQGRVIYGVKADGTEPVSVATESFFMAARDAKGDRAVVVGPVFAPIAQTWVIVFARPVRTERGEFIGVVYANFATNSFEKVFGSVQLGPNGAATIRGSDMALVHRVPTTRNAVGSRNTSKELTDVIAAQPEGGVYVAATALDGIERSNAYRKLRDYPFYVIVGQATGDYLKGWVTSLVLVVGLTAFALTGAGMAAFYAFRAQRRLAVDLADKSRLANELKVLADERSLLNAELEVRVRQAQAATVAKDAFLSHVSHELRTPLHQMAGLGDLVKRQPLSERQQAWMEKLDGAVQRMVTMVDQVLEFVKLESEQASFSRMPLNWLSFAQRLEDRWRPRVESAGLAWSADFEKIGDGLQGDVPRIERCVDALLDNAMHYTTQGFIHFRCELIAREPEALTVQFTVEDSGNGFDESVRSRLFGLFEQADLSSTSAQTGMGLSLALVRKTARLMGGDAGCSSQAGKGSSFWFSVRLITQPAQPAGRPTMFQN